MALLSCLRFIFSRQGVYWVLPALISLIMFFDNLQSLLIFGEEGISSVEYTLSDVSPFFIAILWYLTVIVFHHALTRKIPINSFENDSIKNRHEAAYLAKYEARQRKRIRKKNDPNEVNSLKMPHVPEYRTFDDD